MASFFGVSSFLNATDDQIASSATFSGTETDLFPGGGVFIAKLPSSYAGMQIAALPDVVRLDLAGSYTLVDEVTIYAIHIYAHYVTTSSSGQVIEQGYREQTYAGSQPDEVLSTLYPTDAVDSNFAAVIVPALPGDNTDAFGNTTHYDQLYVAVDGGKTDGFLESWGVTDADEGRFLLTVGAVGGQRDTAWGDWVNVIELSVPTPPPSDPWYAPDDHLFDTVGSHSSQSDSAGATAGLTGLNVAADGTVTWQDPNDGTLHNFDQLTTAVQSLVGGGLDLAQAVSHVWGGVLGDLAVETYLDGLQENSADPLAAAAAGVADQVLTSISVKEALDSFVQRQFEILQAGADALTSGNPTADDAAELDAQMKASAGQLVTDLGVALTGATGETVQAVAQTYSRVSAWFHHSIVGLSASYANAASSTLAEAAVGHQDIYLGDSFGNHVDLGDGNDAAYGADGDDQMLGGDGNDLLDGGAGADTLDGGAGNDWLIGGDGVDYLYGGTGNDTFLVDSQADLVFENAGEGTDTIDASAGFYLYANIENLTLGSGAGDIFGVGNELANTITGNEGSNLLIAGAGNDTVHGGAGVDSLFGQDGADKLYGDEGIDYLVGGIGNDTLDGGADADALYGEDGNDTLWGGSTFDTDILVGGAGDDVLRGDSGLGDYDLMDGGAGNDTYYVDTGDDLTFEAANGGTDTVYANVAGANNGVYLYANVENLVLLGTTTFGVGNELANVLTGNDSANWLLGGDGDDTLNGKAGGDVLFGQGGNDTFVFEQGTGGDVIGDFVHGDDTIDVHAFGFASFADLQSHFAQVGSDGAIDLGGGDFVVLQGVTMASLDAGDFVL